MSFLGVFFQLQFVVFRFQASPKPSSCQLQARRYLGCSGNNVRQSVTQCSHIQLLNATIQKYANFTALASACALEECTLSSATNFNIKYDFRTLEVRFFLHIRFFRSIAAHISASAVKPNIPCRCGRLFGSARFAIILQLPLFLMDILLPLWQRGVDYSFVSSYMRLIDFSINCGFG